MHLRVRAGLRARTGVPSQLRAWHRIVHRA